MLPGKTYGVDDILRIVWDRRWLILAPAVLVGIAVGLYARTLPDQFRSETTILIVPQKVPESYVRATVTSSVEDRLPSLRQQILSRERLERTIIDFNLYPDERTASAMDALVARMRQAIEVNIVRGDAFSVSFISTSPQSAKLVAERLASQFIAENVREREVLAEGTNQFLESQLDEARVRLEEHERKLADYRQRYSGQLPSQLDSNLQLLNNLNLQAQSIANDVERDRDRLLTLTRELANVRDGSAAMTHVAAVPGAAGGLLSRLDTARATLAELRSRLRPEHPDRVTAERLVGELERAAASAPARVADVGAEAPLTAEAAERRGRLDEVRAEIDNLERQIARKQQEQVRIRDLVASYQARVEATPARESEMIALTRDYETLKNIYTTLLSKREDSAVAANLERRQISEQFKVLDEARVPQRPFSPNRLQLNLLGIIAGFAMGIGLAALLEYRDATLKTEEDVRQCLALPVLAAIPVIANAAPARPTAVTGGAVRVLRWIVRGSVE